MLKLARKYHKWLMVFVGAQFLIWACTGLYMVSMNIHFIHGESMVDQQKEPLNLKNVQVSMTDLLERFPNATRIKLQDFMGRPVYRFNDGKNGKVVMDAQKGRILPQVSELKAREIALHYYAQSNQIKRVTLFRDALNMPPELSGRHLPFWQVTFDGLASPTLYISQQTGAIVTKRHNFWRLFDWMWRFHIMDYDDGENVSNGFLFIVALLGFVASILGAILTYHKVLKRKRKNALA